MSYTNNILPALAKTNFEFEGQTNLYNGKVRDVYAVDDLLVMVATDRISAFDHILPQPVPDKGKVLNQLAVYYLEASRDIVPNWLLDSPDPNVSVGLKCEPVKIEMVIRGYLAGHAWREYSSGKKNICGVPFPSGMSEADAFPGPIITPTTKAEEGHDMDISRTEILDKKLVDPVIYAQMEDYTYQLFQRGSEMALKRGLILVDTKYEFGLYKGKVYLMDEIHTPDSSRYYIAEGYEEKQARKEKQTQLSKEFVREWLMSRGFQGLTGQVIPEMGYDFILEIRKRYISLYEQLTGKLFENSVSNVNIEDRIFRNVTEYLQKRNQIGLSTKGLR